MKQNMQAHYVEAYHVPGIAGLPGGSAEALFWKEGPASAVLTTKVDTHLELADRVAAAGHGLLTGLFNPSKTSPAEKIAATVEEIKAERAKTYQSGVFLVASSTEHVSSFDISNARDAGDFLVGSELADTPALKASFSKVAQRCVAAVNLLLRDGADPRITKVASAVYFTAENVSKPIFSYTLKFGGGSLYLTTSIEGSTIEKAQEIVDAITAGGMEKVTDLYVLSLVQSGDSYRAFLSAWTAFEILIHQAFKTTYAPRFFKLLEDSSPPSAMSYFKRIKNVMSDKHRLLDKFTIIASLLAPADAEADLGAITELKKARDDIVHKAAAMTTFPAADAQRFLRKYLLLHLAEHHRW